MSAREAIARDENIRNLRRQAGMTSRWSPDPLTREIPDIFIPPTQNGNAGVLRGRNENSGMTTVMTTGGDGEDSCRLSSACAGVGRSGWGYNPQPAQVIPRVKLSTFGLRRLGKFGLPVGNSAHVRQIVGDSLVTVNASALRSPQIFVVKPRRARGLRA